MARKNPRFVSAPPHEKAERKRLMAGILRYGPKRASVRAAWRAVMQRMSLNELREADPETIEDLLEAGRRRRSRKNPRSTGFIAAKIRAHTARKNSGRRSLSWSQVLDMLKVPRRERHLWDDMREALEAEGWLDVAPYDNQLIVYSFRRLSPGQYAFQSREEVD